MGAECFVTWCEGVCQIAIEEGSEEGAYVGGFA